MNLPLPITADCWFLTGPTAAGKTSVALALAEKLGAEILSMDSMAVYRGMDIGTAKPSLTEREQIPHHLIDCLDPSEELSLAGYIALAERNVAEIRRRGRQPLFVGGTPLYLKALLRGIFQGPPADWALRKALQELAVTRGNAYLHARLAEVDPLAAKKLHAGDLRRVIRALEVHQLTGQPISQLQQQFEQRRAAQDCRVFVLDWPREALHERIEARVDAMFVAGLVQELHSLLERGQSFSRTAAQALGYREVLDHLAGQQELTTTIELVKTHTRQFAKRQLTWFRSLSECRRVAMRADRTPPEVARQIIALA